MPPASDLPRFVVFGEALTDLVRVDAQHWRSVAGGSCWNVARVAATLGIDTAWAGAVSDDLFGREILEHSRIAGLDPRFAQTVAKPPLLAVVHETQPPRYFFIGSDSADLAFDEMLLPAGWQDACAFAHFGCISLVRQPLGARLEDIARGLKQRGTRISFDPNHRNLMGPDYWQQFERMAMLADVIKISDEDIAGIYPARTLSDAIDHIRALAPAAMLLYTRGAEGLSLYHGEQRIDQASFRIEVADTVGAGDSCLGAFVASQLATPEAGAAQHLRFAAATAALVCAQAGAYAPHHDEVQGLLAGHTD